MTPDEWNIYSGWRDAFAKIMDARYYTIEWLDYQVLSGAAIFVSTSEAAAIYEIRQYPTGAKDIHGLLCAGDLDAIRNELIPAACEHGRSTGCIGFVVESREGWTRALRQLGFDPYQAAVRKEL